MRAIWWTACRCMGATANTLAMSQHRRSISGASSPISKTSGTWTWSFSARISRTAFSPTPIRIGKTIGIDGRPFEVIGVGKAKGSVFGQSQDNYVAIPDQTYFKIYGAAQGISYDFRRWIATSWSRPRMKSAC